MPGELGRVVLRCRTCSKKLHDGFIYASNKRVLASIAAYCLERGHVVTVNDQVVAWDALSKRG